MMHTSRSGHPRNFQIAYKWVALCALALACAPPPVVREGWDATQGPAALLAASASLAQFADLTAEAAIELRRGEVRDRGTALVQLVNPDLFRVEVRGPFFTHIFTALLEGDSLTVYGRGMDQPCKRNGAWPTANHVDRTRFGLLRPALRFARLRRARFHRRAGRISACRPRTGCTRGRTAGVARPAPGLGVAREHSPARGRSPTPRAKRIPAGASALSTAPSGNTSARYPADFVL